MQWVEQQLAQLHKSESRVLNIGLLETTVDTLRARTAQSMWDMMTRVGKLGPLIGALRDYMLLGKGQLFLEVRNPVLAHCARPLQEGAVLQCPLACPLAYLLRRTRVLSAESWVYEYSRLRS